MFGETESSNSPCPICYMKFETIHSLNLHIEAHHKTANMEKEGIQLFCIGSMPPLATSATRINPPPNKLHTVEDKDAFPEQVEDAFHEQVENAFPEEDEDTLNEEDEDTLNEEDEDTLNEEDEDTLNEEDEDTFTEEYEDTFTEEYEDMLYDEETETASEDENTVRNEIEEDTYDDGEPNIIQKERIKETAKKDSKIGVEKSSEVLLTKDSPDIPPSLDEDVYFQEEYVKFEYLLLFADITTARINVKNVFAKETTSKWSRSFSMEWLDEHLPQACNWKRSTLLDRFAKAEKSGRQFVNAGTKKPTTKKEEEMGAIVAELDQIRENLREFSVQKSKRIFHEAKEKTGKKSRENKPESKKIRRSEDKDDEDKFRKAAVKNKRKNKEKDEDEELEEIPKGLNGLIDLATKSLQNGFNQEDENGQKIDNLEEKQEDLAAEVKQNSGRLGEIENNQKQQSKSLEDIKESQNKSEINQKESAKMQKQMFNLIAKHMGVSLDEDSE